MFDTIETLAEAGFQGFVTVREMMQINCAGAPREKGVYVIFYGSEALPTFLDLSRGGHFKGRNPTVAVRTLEKAWIPGAKVLYIGQSGGGDSSGTLLTRLRQYMRFGSGEPVGHWGGRFIWQIEEYGDLIVCWKTIPSGDPREVETEYIKQFVKRYGRRPFANVSG